MSAPTPILHRCTGHNNRIDSLQTPEGQEQNLTELSKAVNVRISDSMRVERSSGLTTIHDLTDGHSLFCDGGECVVNDGTSMFTVASDLSLSPAIRNGMSGYDIDHAQVGNAIYYSNLFENGIVDEGVNYPWLPEVYNGLESLYFELSVPFFEHIELHHGFMLGSIGNALYTSEIGQYGLFCMKFGIPLASRIVMIKHVKNGAFVSDEKQIWFFSGLDPHGFVVGDPVHPFPAVEWGDAIESIDGMQVKGYETPGECAIFVSKQGLCLGTPDGAVLPVNVDKIVLPDCSGAASLLMGHEVIYTLR